MPWMVFLLGLLLLGGTTFSAQAGKEGQSRFPTITGPCDFVFPDAHGAHPDHRIEWWYYTGNLRTPQGRPFGFQLTFFRSRMHAPGTVTTHGEQRSTWRTAQLHPAHFAISDLESETFHYEKRTVRAAVNLAGVSRQGDDVLVHQGGWSTVIGPDQHAIQAATVDLGLDLRLIPKKPVAIQGNGGYSRKGSRPESASCYYSFTRLAADGTVRVGDQTFPVTGEAWMDHEYASNLLEEGLVGWDWFSVQLDDGWDLMAFRLRPDEQRARLGQGGWAGGGLIDPQGRVTPLEPEDLRFTPGRTWTSPRSKATYPLWWEIAVPKVELSLTISPRMLAQELVSEPGSGGVTYWEGAVEVRGARSGEAVSGHGYAELTGYAGPVPLGPGSAE
ncbi:MAG: carotenoid 1,2-hydratase [Desulfovibrionales bacterium]|nr:MAG: carotenoid 1,2-hydratase [Desulfovibrionales bacterium]